MPVNIAASNTPPPRRAPKKTNPTTSRSTTSADVRQERQDAVNGLFQLGSVVAMAFGQWADAGAINTHAPGITTEVVKLADKYESIGKSIDALSQVSPFAGLVTAVAPLLIQMAANHRVLNSSQAAALGATDPHVLGEQMQLHMQMQALQQQREIEAMKRAVAEERAAYEREMGLRVDNVEFREEPVPA